MPLGLNGWHPRWHPIDIVAIAEPSPPRQIAEHKIAIHLPFRRYCGHFRVGW